MLERGKQAVNLLFEVKNFIPKIVDEGRKQIQSKPPQIFGLKHTEVMSSKRDESEMRHTD